LWKVILLGPEHSPFEGAQLVISFKLDNFPFKSPIVSFDTKVYHPNVDTDGSICTDMLEIGNKWAPVKNLVKII
jgi:ubiquitin-conjugating enzyme E2 D/E